MYVGLAMLKHVPTITSQTLVTKADRMMEEHKLWILLVVEDGLLQGYVAKEDIRAALPSGATTFSKYELNYLLSKLTVKNLVRQGMPTVQPETEIEVAAKLMHDHDLAGLAVVNQENKLKGYLSQGSMLAVLIEEMGLELGGQRIAIEAQDRKGLMAEISTFFFDQGINILSTSIFYRGHRRLLVFRIQTDDLQQVHEKLEAQGYLIAGPEYFAPEWSG